MTVVELKKLIIQRIEAIEDESFLAAINTILDMKTSAGVLNLTEEMEAEIEEARAQVRRGEFTEQKILDKKITEWLSEK